MSDSVTVESLLDLPSMRVTSINKKELEVEISCESIQPSAQCPQCLQDCKEVKKYHTRRVRDLAMQDRTVVLQVRVRQFHCIECRRYFSEQFEWVEKKQTLSKRYVAKLVELSKRMTIQQVSIQENLVWDVVLAAIKRHETPRAAVKKNSGMQPGGR